MLKTLIGLTFAVAALAQSPTFDVATIKPSPLPQGGRFFFSGPSGGPGTKDPALFKCAGCAVSFLITQAWDLQPYQVSGPPTLYSERFEVTAKVPEGATKEQFREMMQNLLTDRFKMTFHREKKEGQVYDLVVAKSGPKLKEAAPVDPDAPAPELPPPPPMGGPGRKMELDKDGFPNLPKMPGRPITFMMNGRARTMAVSVTMDDLAKFLTNQVGGKPVNNATGLKGKFDYTLTFAPDNMGPGMMVPPPPGGPGGIGPQPPPGEAADPLPNIFAALQEQLGLRLEAKKGAIDYLVVDHVEKVPSEN